MFDSNKDDWSQNTSVFGDKIFNKSNLIFIIEDTNNNKFGGYVSISVNKYNHWFNDSNSFVFSLKSNGRINGMKKFNIVNTTNTFRVDAKTSNSYLFIFGGGYDIRVNRSNMNGHNCKQQSFNYEGITYSLCNANSGQQNFTPKRIIVIQMK